MMGWGREMLERFRRYQKTITIKRKLLFINMVVAILPVVVFGILITRVYEDTVDKRTRQSVEDSSMVIADRITRVLKDAENCSNYLTVNINKVMETKATTKKLSLAEQKAITNELYVAKIVFDEINSIAFISMDEKVYVSDNTILTNTEAILESEQLETLKETSGKSIWFPLEEREFLVQDITQPVLTLGKKVVQINTGETLGYIFLNVDISAIENNLTNQLINYRLVDENETVISSVVSSKYITEENVNELLMETNSNQVKTYLGRKYYLSNYEIADYRWRLVGVTDLNEFNVEAKKILYLGMVIALAAILLEILLSNYLSRMITVPLLKLKNGAEEIAGGNMNLRLHFKSEDEIGQLGNSFNYMSEQVQELLVKVNYEAKKKREYELSLLQEQVKPHFLYNSLDIVIKLSEMNRNKEARRAVRRLADYYRNSLSDSKEIITIGQEIKIVEDYLELQRIRYNDLFTYEVAIDEDILQMLIPKLTLQPLIENAIYHGMKYKEETGILRITGRKNEGGVILSVEDNGAGMVQECSEALLQNKPEGHFGVYSVNHRIKLYFGEEYGIAVDSEVGIGTKIDVMLPLVAEWSQT
jgi:two-component system sensor histidine kinase YesM